ncbi:MAG: hypothetical protein HFG31_07950 [Eubacterium sp.]|nr:hypothetical protein [Eubacterium sp.]
MGGGILAIYDLESGYADSLMQYINQKQNMPFKTVAFTNKNALYEYLKEHHIDILLISVTDMENKLEDEDIEKIILLSNGKIFSEYIGYASIYKYQSSERIIREVLDYFVEVHNCENIVTNISQSVEIVAVYSPVKRIGQTILSLTLGQILANDFTTLYINMEEFSAFDKIFHQSYEGDLSDLMYFYKQSPDILPIKLKAIVNTIHKLDYIPPLVYSKDLRNIDTGGWVELIKSVAATGMYEKIVIDLSSVVADVFSILDICSKVYMPTINDMVSSMKISAFEEYLVRSENSEIIDKIIKVNMPRLHMDIEDESFLDRYLWNEFGDYVRSILKEAA